MGRLALWHALAAWQCCAVAAAAAAPSDAMNLVLGTQAIYGPTWRRYNFTSDNILVESAGAATERLGGNQLKITLSQTACDGYRIDCSEVASLASLAQRPEYAAVFEHPKIRYYVMWLHAFATPDAFLTRDWTPAALAAEYNETKAWAAHMLRTYAATGKVFLAGNWEGDWMLMGASGCRGPGGKFNMTCDPTAAVLGRFTAWASTRQRAIDDAKAEAAAAGLVDPPALFYYIEFNLGPEAVHGKPGIVNDVLPAVNPDLASYSSYSATNAYQTTPDVARTDKAFHEVLQHAHNKLPQKRAAVGSLAAARLDARIIIGEFGMHAKAIGPTAARQGWYMACVLRAAVAFGTPLVLYWELYDNDSTIPLVPRSNADTPLLTWVQRYLADARGFADAYAHTHGALPTQRAFSSWAAARFGAECDGGGGV